MARNTRKTEARHDSGPHIQLPAPTYTVNKDFVSRYASNVHFDPSIWGMRLVFGELINGNGPQQVIDQHTAISMSWAQLKLLQAYLELHVSAFENNSAEVVIPEKLMPPLMDLPPELAKDPETARKFAATRKRVEDIRRRLGESTPSSSR